MNPYYRYEPRPIFSFGGDISSGLKKIIIANVIVFFFMVLIPMRFWITWFALDPSAVFLKLRIWQPFTYLFLHGGFWHLFMNMFVLWMFGNELERLWGTREFVRFYFVTGVGAGFFSVVPYYLNVLLGNQSFSPSIIGASGAVYGILLAYALTYPNRLVYLYFFFPIRVKYLVIFMGLLTFFSVGQRDGVAHVTHLGGLVVAWFYLRRGGKYRGLDLSWSKIQNAWRRLRSHSSQRGFFHSSSELEMRRELDALLDKISRVGYDGLSFTERQRLWYLSQKLSQHRDD